jgi:hypothetical protein
VLPGADHRDLFPRQKVLHERVDFRHGGLLAGCLLLRGLSFFDFGKLLLQNQLNSSRIAGWRNASILERRSRIGTVEVAVEVNKTELPGLSSLAALSLRNLSRV